MGSLIGKAVQNASETHSIISMKVGIENHINDISKFAAEQDETSSNALHTINEMAIPFKQQQKCVNDLQTQFENRQKVKKQFNLY